jgi:hypothetical protein
MRKITAYLKPLLWCWMLLHLLSVPLYAAGQGAAGETPAQVMEAFNKSGDNAKEAGISDHRKQQIMFIMGIALLVFIITTVSLGVAMVVFAKPVFLPHMIFAGFSLTLAIVHSIVAIVWFFPK